MATGPLFLILFLSALVMSDGFVMNYYGPLFMVSYFVYLVYDNQSLATFVYETITFLFLF